LMSVGRAEPVPLDRVRAAFHYVRSGRTISPEKLPDATALAALLEGRSVVDDIDTTVPVDELSEPR
jgi:DNA helicase-2/ATP-dependent DNA helicase PcrA